MEKIGCESSANKLRTIKVEVSICLGFAWFNVCRTP